MNRTTLLGTLGFGFTLAVLGAPVSTPAAAQTLVITAAFDPNPPQTGPSTITVTLSDQGKPVKGAKVTIKTDMPVMSMIGPTLTATDNGDGTYSAQTNLTDATTWRFRINAKAGAKAGATVVQVVVK